MGVLGNRCWCIVKINVIEFDEFCDGMGIYGLFQDALCHFDEIIQKIDEKLHISVDRMQYLCTRIRHSHVVTRKNEKNKHLI